MMIIVGNIYLFMGMLNKNNLMPFRYKRKLLCNSGSHFCFCNDLFHDKLQAEPNMNLISPQFTSSGSNLLQQSE